MIGGMKNTGDKRFQGVGGINGDRKKRQQQTVRNCRWPQGGFRSVIPEGLQGE